MNKRTHLILAVVAALAVLACALRAGEPLVKSGQRVVFLGDSITAGATGPGGTLR